MKPVRVILSLVTALLCAGPVAAQAAPVPAAAPAADSEDAIIRRLIDSLKDSDPEVRQNIAVALAKIGTGCVDELTEALKDANADRRAGAAYALGLMGPAARAAMPALLDALADKEPDVRRQASFAVGRLIPQREPGRPPSRFSDPVPRGVSP